MKPETTDALLVIEHLGSLCATPGVDEETKLIANKMIHRLIVLNVESAVKIIEEQVRT